MEYKLTAQSILHQLGVGKSYNGYKYIVYGIDLLEHDDVTLNGITKTLYIDIAKKYQTSHTCVERNIRTVIEVIWRRADSNHALLLKIFGERYLLHKPSNKMFLELLYEYIKAHNILEQLLGPNTTICPISHQVCNAYYEIIEKLIEKN